MGKGKDIIKNQVLEDVRSSLFEDEEDYQLDHTYLQFESKFDRYKTLPLDGYINKIRPYFKQLINNFIDTNCTWKKGEKRDM